MAFFGLINDLPDYQPVAAPGYSPIPGPSQQSINQVNANTTYANRPLSSFQGDINQNVKSQADSLMGPRAAPGSDEEAMNARGNQIYESQINRLLNNSSLPAAQRQTQLQGQAFNQGQGIFSQNLDQDSATFSNYQQRRTIDWHQVAFEREAAITQEATKRQLYSKLFGGLGAVGGAFAAKGIYNARHPASIEGGLPSTPSRSELSGAGEVGFT